MSGIRVAGLTIGLFLGLAACMDGTGGIQSAPGSTAGGGATVERDVEAPDVFSKRDEGLWDGRPSLGGVWVAHPDVKAPERVIIRNTESGKETIGALFRRERMNPGPVFQVSAEAAGAVGMLAGAPTGLEVVALRTEEVQTEPEPDVQPAPEPETPPQADVSDADTPPAQTAQTDTTAQAQDAVNDETLIALPETDEPRRGGFFSRLFKRADTPEPEITSAPLDATAPVPVAPTTQTPPMPTPLAGNAAASPATSNLERPFVQIGIFSVEANATGAARSMRDAGLSANVKPGKAQGNSFWRVVVGPAATEAERRQLLAKVKQLGFADAYAVRR